MEIALPNQLICTTCIVLCDWLMHAIWLHGLEGYDWLISATCRLGFTSFFESFALWVHVIRNFKLRLQNFLFLHSLRSFFAWFSASFFAWCSGTLQGFLPQNGDLVNVRNVKVRIQRIGSHLNARDVVSILVEHINQQPKSQRVVVLAPLL